MTLRIMLLGLVASMGFNLPSNSDLTCWAQAGREWVNARMADPSGLCVEANGLDTLPTDCLQADAKCPAPVVVVERPNSSEDKAFEAVANSLAADFAADLIAQGPETSPSDLVPSLIAAEVPPAVGLPSGEELLTQVIETPGADEVAVVAEPTVPVEVEVVEVTDAARERLDRIAAAVRLTRDAVQAWGEVIQDSVDETAPTR